MHDSLEAPSTQPQKPKQLRRALSLGGGGCSFPPCRCTNRRAHGGEGLPVSRAAAAPEDLRLLFNFFPMLMGIRLSTHALPLSRSPAAKRDRYVPTLVVPRRALPSPRRGGPFRRLRDSPPPGSPADALGAVCTGSSGARRTLHVAAWASSPPWGRAGHEGPAPRLPARRHHRARQPNVVLFQQGHRYERSPRRAAA